MIFKVMLCHRVGAKRGVVLVGFADYSWFVIKTHLHKIIDVTCQKCTF